MARAIGVDDIDRDQLKALALQMLIPVNIATEAAWCALMHDREGMDKKVDELRTVLDSLV